MAEPFNLTELEKLEALHAVVKAADWTGPVHALVNQEARWNIALHNAFPAMAKALREAWSESERVMSDERMSEQQILATIRHAQNQKDEAIRQRDEARAELAKIKGENKTLQLRLDESLESEARLKDALRWSNKSIRDHVVTIDRQKQLIQSLTDCLSEAKAAP